MSCDQFGPELQSSQRFGTGYSRENGYSVVVVIVVGMTIATVSIPVKRVDGVRGEAGLGDETGHPRRNFLCEDVDTLRIVRIHHTPYRIIGRHGLPFLR